MACHETFLGIYKEMAGREFTQALRPHMYRSARRICFAYLRQSRMFASDYAPNRRDEDIDRLMTGTQRTPNGSTGWCENVVDRSLLFRIMNRLSFASQELLALRYVHNLSVSEIAYVLEVTEENVKTRVDRFLMAARTYDSNSNV